MHLPGGLPLLLGAGGRPGGIAGDPARGEVPRGPPWPVRSRGVSPLPQPLLALSDRRLPPPPLRRRCRPFAPLPRRAGSSAGVPPPLGDVSLAGARRGGLLPFPVGHPAPRDRPAGGLLRSLEAPPRKGAGGSPVPGRPLARALAPLPVDVRVGRGEAPLER